MGRRRGYRASWLPYPTPSTNEDTFSSTTRFWIRWAMKSSPGIKRPTQTQSLNISNGSPPKLSQGNGQTGSGLGT